MYDIVDVIKNIQTLTVTDSAFSALKDFERVLDELDIYVYSNWEDGELLSGPKVSRYMVTCRFMWPYKKMPDPVAGKLLSDYGCHVTYQKTRIAIPRKVYKPSDFRPGTKKGKIDLHPIWVVSISMPKTLMSDIYQGYQEKDSARLANLMKQSTDNQLSAQNTPTEMPVNAPPLF